MRYSCKALSLTRTGCLRRQNQKTTLLSFAKSWNADTGDTVVSGSRLGTVQIWPVCNECPSFIFARVHTSICLGSLFTDDTTSWNVAHLPSALSRLLPSSEKGLPGVNTPYLYFGMWRATFAWHVEDMDLFSINYIHFGAPKFWYAVPQGRASALEQTMRGTYASTLSFC